MKPVQPVIALAIALVVAASAGYGGYYYRGSQIPTRGNFAGRAAAGSQGAGGRGMMNGGRVTGQILSSDATSITVKLTDGSSKIILLSGQTMINKATQGAKTDLTAGTTVAVFGATNSDGSVTAQNIQINPVSPTPAPVK